MAVNTLKHLRGCPAAPYKGNLQGIHALDRTNPGPAPLFSYPERMEGREIPALIPLDAHSDDKIPDLERLKSRKDLCPLVKPQASLSRGDKNKSPLKIE